MKKVFEVKKLFEEYPRPWRIVAGERALAGEFSGDFEVFSADGKTVIYGGTYTGDGDEQFNLMASQVVELVEFINNGA